VTPLLTLLTLRVLRKVCACHAEASQLFAQFDRKRSARCTASPTSEPLPRASNLQGRRRRRRRLCGQEGSSKFGSRWQNVRTSFQKSVPATCSARWRCWRTKCVRPARGPPNRPPFIYAACGMLKLVERCPALALVLLREISIVCAKFNRQYLREVLQTERLAIVAVSPLDRARFEESAECHRPDGGNRGHGKPRRRCAPSQCAFANRSNASAT